MVEPSLARRAPVAIKRMGQDALEIVWPDGHRAVYPNRYLRDNCPCASCRERHPPHGSQAGTGAGLQLPILGGPPLHAVQIGVVGRYAISIQWSDGHDTGIYSYETLRGLCPCAQCRPPAPDPHPSAE